MRRPTNINFLYSSHHASVQNGTRGSWESDRDLSGVLLDHHLGQLQAIPQVLIVFLSMHGNYLSVKMSVQPELLLLAASHFQTKMQPSAAAASDEGRCGRKRVKISSTESSCELPDVWMSIAFMIHPDIPTRSESSVTWSRCGKPLPLGSLRISPVFKTAACWLGPATCPVKAFFFFFLS